MSRDVTVLIPSYNPGEYLRDALASVFAQTSDRWEVILVDDASTDDSLEGVRGLLGDPRIRLLHNRENLGQSRALNIGLAATKTPFLVQLDADDWFPRRALEVLLAEADRVPEDVAVLHGNMKVYIDPDAPEAGSLPRYLYKRGRQYRDRYDFLFSNSSVWPRFYRTAALREVGGWPTDDPYCGRYLEDKRILLRLIEHHRFRWIDETLYVHRRHDYNQTMKMAIYSFMTEWNVRDALKRWGDPRQPVFATDLSGWKYLIELREEGEGGDEDDQPGEATSQMLWSGYPSERMSMHLKEGRSRRARRRKKRRFYPG